MLFTLYKIANFDLIHYLPFFVLLFWIIMFGCDIFQFFKYLFTKYRDYEGTLFGNLFGEVSKYSTIFAIVFILIFLASSFSLVFSNKSIVHYFGCTVIETLDDGQYSYYVEATSENWNTYTLPAKLIIDWDYDYDDKPTQTYTVENVYFKNGGYLYFKDPETIYDFDDTAYQYDQNGRQWEIQLTRKEAETTQFKETPLYNRTSFIYCFIMLGLILLNTIIALFYCVKYSLRG